MSTTHYQDPKREAKRLKKIERQNEKLTKTETRTLLLEAKRKLEDAQWVELDVWQRIKALVKGNRSGSHACACGLTIARNKTACSVCASQQTAPPVDSAPATA